MMQIEAAPWERKKLESTLIAWDTLFATAMFSATAEYVSWFKRIDAAWF